MSDITIQWEVAQGRGDWVLSGALIETGQDLETAVIVSLFTDRVAAADDAIPDGTGDRRGWWGDSGHSMPIGSRLWLLDRAKGSGETLASARDYIAEALQWLIDDGVVASFEIAVEWTAPSQLGAQVIATRNDGTTVPMSFPWVWAGIS